jgi:hypothetical protein
MRAFLRWMPCTAATKAFEGFQDFPGFNGFSMPLGRGKKGKC